MKESIHKEDIKFSNKVLLTNGSFCDKIEAHIKGNQHYAFSVFLFDSMGNMLLQKRASGKYHSGGLWSNTCCSHPLSVSSIKTIEEQAKSRLYYEMGMNNVSLNFEFLFTYNEKCSEYNENEIDFIFSCISEQTPIVNRNEVDSYEWVSIENLIENMRKHPEKYTVWFRKIIETYGEKLIKKTIG